MKNIAMVLCLLLALCAMGQSQTPATRPAPASKAAEKNGLQMTVTMGKASFAADEPLTYAVEFKNTSNQRFSLYDARAYWNWTTRFEDVKAAGPWQLHATFLGKREQSPRDDSLLPGESLTILVEVDSAKKTMEYVWKGQQEKPEAPLRQLKPGKYRVTVEIKLIDPGEDKPGANPHWSGTIKSEPVEFAITDKSATK